MPLDWSPKDPDEKLDYVIDWSARMSEGDSIVAAVWSVPAGITKTDESWQGSKTTIWLEGGSVNQTYKIGCRITTAEGRIMDQTVSLFIRTR